MNKEQLLDHFRDSLNDLQRLDLYEDFAGLELDLWLEFLERKIINDINPL